MPNAPSHVNEVIRNPEEINLMYVAMTRAKRKLELPRGCYPLHECFVKNRESRDFFHKPDLRPKGQRRYEDEIEASDRY
jgi:hypothetical protein